MEVIVERLLVVGRDGPNASVALLMDNLSRAKGRLHRERQSRPNGSRTRRSMKEE